MRTNKYKATTNTHSSSSLQAKGRSGSETLSLQRSLNNLEKHNFFSYGVSGGWMKFFFLFQPTSITQIIIFRNNLWHETSLREIKLLPMNKNKFQPKVNHFSINFSHRDRCLQRCGMIMSVPRLHYCTRLRSSYKNIIFHVL